ncbi:Catechol 2,3-dioxygenase [Tistlia consotensis]|uniref:Catechol 2,3-dioxygenase n=1 Tax=Tistlia consotensis USBA 355 TaxID=560819 RepID=A0A1Y6C9E9_9PROT|nr:VOC family protein [Tistlia consotensis]SMF43538.1 Catechol 2,3-dioxygenase [Tistlia consotensis USBA 355]SNR42667.1 Catechol 2,3-dioxygenase [Tistlia consotensis]
MAIRVERLDHLVLTARDLEATCAWYRRVLGMTRESFGDGRVALTYGRQKINVHPYPSPVWPLVADIAIPGSLDLCFVVAGPIEAVAAELAALGVEIELGPVARSGALGPITSLYLRDPDRNLVELAVYES